MSLVRALLVLVLCLPAVLAMSPVAAQTKAAPNLIAAQDKVPAAIDVADIPSQADLDERFAQEVIQRARSADPTLALANGLDAIERSVDNKARLFVDKNLKTLPVMRLESLERHWKFDARQFARWQSDLRQASAPYARGCRRTGASPRRLGGDQGGGAGGQPGHRARRPHRVGDRRSSRTPSRRCRIRSRQQISLGRRGNAVDARIQAGQKSVAVAIDSIDSRLMRLDSPPLWVVAGRATTPTRNRRSSRSSPAWTIESALRQAVQRRRPGQPARAALAADTVAAAAGVAEPARIAQAAPTGLENEATTRVLRRPLSSWILLSMMGVLVFEPDAPLLAHQFAMLVALVPVLRLLPPHSKRLLGPWPYVATGLYLLERLGFVFLASELLYRWYYLGLTVAGAAADAVAAVAFAPHALARVPDPAARVEPHHPRGGLVRRGAAGRRRRCRNVVGNVSLAEMLTERRDRQRLPRPGAVRRRHRVHHAAAAADRAPQRRRASGSPANTPRRCCEGFDKLLKIAAVVGWIVFAMSRFRIFRPVVRRGRVGADATRSGSARSRSASATSWCSRSRCSSPSGPHAPCASCCRSEVLPKMSLPRGVGNSVASLSYYALLLIGLLVALAAAGFKVGQLAFLFGALGVGIGFGLQNVVNNFVSGLILMFERPIQPGDVVEITGTTGRVREIGMRATTIKTFDGADVVVPNGTLLSEKLTNWTLLDMSRRIDIDLGVAYGSEPSQVIALLTRITTETPHVAKTPAPVVLFTGLGASSLNFAIRAWTYDFDNWINIRSELMTRVHAALRDAGIEMPFPQQDVHLRSMSKEVGAMLCRRRQVGAATAIEQARPSGRTSPPGRA